MGLSTKIQLVHITLWISTKSHCFRCRTNTNGLTLGKMKIWAKVNTFIQCHYTLGQNRRAMKLNFSMGKEYKHIFYFTSLQAKKSVHPWQ